MCPPHLRFQLAVCELSPALAASDFFVSHLPLCKGGRQELGWSTHSFLSHLKAAQEASYSSPGAWAQSSPRHARYLTGDTSNISTKKIHPGKQEKVKRAPNSPRSVPFLVTRSADTLHIILSVQPTASSIVWVYLKSREQLAVQTALKLSCT